MGQSPFRNEQFERIAELKAEYFASENPILSMDTKKKELLGNFFRAGAGYTNQGVTTWDHDFKSHAKGLVIPHGLYDLKRNVGHISLGQATTPVNLPVIVFGVGGGILDEKPIPMLTPC